MAKQIILDVQNYKNLCELAGFALYVKSLLITDRFYFASRDKASPDLTEEENSELLNFIEDKECNLDPEVLNDIEDEMTDFDF